MKTRLLLIALITAIAGMGTSLAACSSDDDNNNTGGDAGKDSSPQQDSGPGDDVTFSDVYDQVISQRCIGCHSTTFPDGGARNPSGGLVLKGKDIAYQNLINKEAPGGPCKPDPVTDAGTTWKLVEPNNVAKSLLHSKVSSDAPKCGARMPLTPQGGTPNPLNATQIKLIEDWIATGAKE
ncbi:hypothetical protein LVJ94_00420 [Pendulispora rubella]|uniref:Cytochrome c domain-containing protein n=1 Tax=Pendulispora rubella TaxID=2741070 RepID=A0ABZ2L711_9BACT